MTESEWLSCGDPVRMLAWLTGTSAEPNRNIPWRGCTNRKLRLFVCACCHQVWDGLSDSEKKAVETAEAHADGHFVSLKLVRDQCGGGLGTMAFFACCRPGSEGHHATIISQAQIPPKDMQGVLIRDIFGNPFRPSNLAVRWNELHEHAAGAAPRVPSWLTWNDRTIPRLAQAIYDECAFDRMPILADALEEAGCSNADILYHCRNICRHCTDNSGFCWRKVADCQYCDGTGIETAPHVRGCWVIDLLLGKE